ncbi:MAG: DNA mismatch repair protein MutS, partial [Acidobacteriota bacterium]
MRATPMLEQYWALKREAGDALLLYRLGDFYEMFFEDAAYAAPLLGLVLTARHKDSDVEAPMCGIPQHALEPYLARLVAAGKKVAISEQTEPPSKGRALVPRKIVRIVTPGTIVDPERLDARRPNEMAAVTWSGVGAAVATLDLSTGDFSVVTLPQREALSEWLLRRLPSELVFFPSERHLAEALVAALVSSGAEAPALSALKEDSPRGPGAVDLLERHFRTATVEPFGLPGAGGATDAAAALLSYARATQRADCDHVRSLRSEAPEEGLVVDAVTAGHLELFRSARDGGPKGTLFSLLDRTGTSFGARTLRRLVERPLGRRAGIEARLDAVEELQEDGARLESLASAFREIPDLPRLLARLAVGAGSPRDAAALGSGLVRAGRVAVGLGAVRAALLAPGGEASPDGVPFALGESIVSRVVAEPPLHAREGGIFRDGVDAAVDEVRALRRESASILARVEADERALRGIPTLRVKFNQVFGHVFEVPGSARARIPGDALKRQTLANVERYATPELVLVDEKLRSADARLAAREQEMFLSLVAEIVADSSRILAACSRLGLLDSLVSLARVARAGGWVRPGIADEPVLLVEGGRHPVVEALRPREAFVPNDASVGGEGEHLVVLTGPNMGGKSTYL